MLTPFPRNLLHTTNEIVHTRKTTHLKLEPSPTNQLLSKKTLLWVLDPRMLLHCTFGIEPSSAVQTPDRAYGDQVTPLIKCEALFFSGYQLWRVPKLWRFRQRYVHAMVTDEVSIHPVPSSRMKLPLNRILVP